MRTPAAAYLKRTQRLRGVEGDASWQSKLIACAMGFKISHRLRMNV